MKNWLIWFFCYLAGFGVFLAIGCIYGIVMTITGHHPLASKKLTMIVLAVSVFPWSLVTIAIAHRALERDEE
jgi:hypothetical protein